MVQVNVSGSRAPAGSVAAALRLTGVPSTPVAGTVNVLMVGATLAPAVLALRVSLSLPASLPATQMPQSGGAGGVMLTVAPVSVTVVPYGRVMVQVNVSGSRAPAGSVAAALRLTGVPSTPVAGTVNV